MPNSTLVWKGVSMDLYPVLKILRKIEFFILPLLPARWREPPPSYRIALPVLNFLNPYTQKIRFIDALVYSIKKEGYRPYHLDGLGQAGPFTKGENRWLALIFSVVLLGLILAFTGWGREYTAMIKAILLLGGSALALYGAMKLRVSALWAAWGFLCPILALLPGSAVSSWFMVLLGLFVIVWAVPLLDPDEGWKWYDCLGTLPMLFFWMPLPFVPGWSTWLTGVAALLSWGLIWLGMMSVWRLKTGKGGPCCGVHFTDPAVVLGVESQCDRDIQRFDEASSASIRPFGGLSLECMVAGRHLGNGHGCQCLLCATGDLFVSLQGKGRPGSGGGLLRGPAPDR